MIAIKMAAMNFLPICNALELHILDDPIGIRLKNGTQCILVKNSSSPSLAQSSIENTLTGLRFEAVIPS